MPWAISNKPLPAVVRRLRLGLDDPAVANNLGLALHVLGRHDEAAGAFLTVLESRPDDAMAHTNLGAALHALGEDDRALEHISGPSSSIRDSPPRGTTSDNSCWNSAFRDQALPHCQAAVALQPDMAEAHNNLGNAYRALGHFAEARWCYGEAVRTEPTDRPVSNEPGSGHCNRKSAGMKP